MHSQRPSHEHDSITALLLALKSQEARITALEKPAQKSLLKALSENAGMVALLLGLVLTFGSIREMFWIKPHIDHINQIAQFNDAVSSAAKIRQSLIQSQAQLKDPAQQMTELAIARSQILISVSTATLLQRELGNQDIGVPQLLILINEAYDLGDMSKVKELMARALSIKDAPPDLKSDVKLVEAKYLFLTDAVKGRQSFEASYHYLDAFPGAVAARSNVLMNLATFEAGYGDCALAAEDVKRLAAEMDSVYLMPPVKVQISEAFKNNMKQGIGKRCLPSLKLDELLPF